MIELHHGREQRRSVVNADLIETVEATPDTVIKLTTAKKLIVPETPEEIVALVVEYRRRRKLALASSTRLTIERKYAYPRTGVSTTETAMDPATIIGIGLAGVSRCSSALSWRAATRSRSSRRAPILIVFGGTAGVMIASTGLSRRSCRCPKLMIVSMKYKGATIDKVAAIRTIVGMAEKARREGLLALEEEAQNVDDPFLAKGISLVVDGTDPELVKDILESDLDAMEARHSRAGRRCSQTHGRLRADARHHRHRHGPRARAREPLRPGHARAGHLGRVHRDASTASRPRTSFFLPIGEQAQAHLARRGARAHDDRSRASSRSRRATTRASSRRS